MTTMSMKERLLRSLRCRFLRRRSAVENMLESRTLQEIHTPCILAGADQGAPSERAAHALGWFVDTYQGERRISHRRYLHDVQSSVMLFPESDVGLVSFSNFGPVGVASVLNERGFDVLFDRAPSSSLEGKIKEYERRVRGRVPPNARAMPLWLMRVPNRPTAPGRRVCHGQYRHGPTYWKN
jgi:hypothetical protein